ncbi:hypothetical protein VPH35_065963 [Triticum aestivum]
MPPSSPRSTPPSPPARVSAPVLYRPLASPSPMARVSGRASQPRLRLPQGINKGRYSRALDICGSGGDRCGRGLSGALLVRGGHGRGMAAALLLAGYRTDNERAEDLSGT